MTASNAEVAAVIFVQVVVAINLSIRWFRYSPYYREPWWVEWVLLPTWTAWLAIGALIYVVVVDPWVQCSITRLKSIATQE